MFKSGISFLKFSLFVFYCFFTLSVFHSCRPEKKKEQEIIPAKPVPFNDKVKSMLAIRLEKFKFDSVPDVFKDTFLTSTWIHELFRRNEFAPVWTKDSLLLPAADSLISIVKSAFSYGLLSSDYHLPEFEKIIKADTLKRKNNLSVKDVCELNLFLTDAFFRFAVDLHKGRLDPDSLNRVWKGIYLDTTIVLSLQQAIEHNTIKETIERFKPDLPSYKDLNKFLFICKDSIQLNKIMLNLERRRWEKQWYEDYYILINIPSFYLKFYECDTLKLLSRIIVGKPETPSPVRLNSKISHFWVYPYWFVPLSIATKEILPSLKKDTAYLRKHNMELLDGYNNVLNPGEIKWKKYSEEYFPFKIRQRDGDENTLGVLKFIFPNKFDIYLHDTNAPGLFRKDKRALSHGCIRVEKAKQLAKRLINCCVINYNADSLNSDLKNKIRKRVNLFTRVPVHLRYFTCETDSGNIKFYDDIYGLDEKMINNLMIRH
jgi:murein L,D-transpeptidase YcbB/YkuD